MRFIFVVLALALCYDAQAEGFGNYGMPSYGYGGYGNSPYGYGGMNGMGGFGYPSLNPQQRNMAMFYSLLAKARQSTNQSRSKSKSSTKLSPPNFSDSLKAFSESIQASQQAFSQMKPIADVDLSGVFSTLSNVPKHPQHDPLQGLTESTKAMSDQLMKIVQQATLKPAVQNNVPRQTMLLSSAVNNTSKPTVAARMLNQAVPTKPSPFRGIASVSSNAVASSRVESVMHRDLHGAGEEHGNSMVQAHDHSRSPRVVPFE